MVIEEKLSVKLIGQPNNVEDVYRLIEMAGRVSHRSEDNITEESYIEFVKRMEKLKHLSVLEFGPVYLIEKEEDLYMIPNIDGVLKSPHTKVNIIDGLYYVSTNYRVLLENDATEAIRRWTKPVNGYHDKRIMFEVKGPISMSREMNRHRCLSILEESTRYVNYSREKHGGDIKVVKSSTDISEEAKDVMDIAFEQANRAYKKLIELGCKPQEARAILPLNTATKVYYSAFESDWRDFVSKRDITSAHQDIRWVAQRVGQMLSYQI